MAVLSSQVELEMGVHLLCSFFRQVQHIMLALHAGCPELMTVTELCTDCRHAPTLTLSTEWQD